MDPDLATVLVVEDHALTRRFLLDNLAADGYAVAPAGSVAQAERVLEREPVDLAVVDLGLPDGDGLELLRRLRGATRSGAEELGVIVLSGRTAELDRLRAFARGADDFMAKPFAYAELRARVASVLRRARRRPASAVMRVGTLEIDALGHEVRVDGAPVRLSKKEFALLCALARDPTRVFTREELLQSVWGFSSAVRTRTLDTHAFRLRQRLAAAGFGGVVNVWGVGYRLAPGRAA